MLKRPINVLIRQQISGAGYGHKMCGPSSRYRPTSVIISRLYGSSEQNAYKTLGISPGATEKEIKKAYREKVLKHHPDRADGSDEGFKKVKQAYDLLRQRSRKTKEEESSSGESRGRSSSKTRRSEKESESSGAKDRKSHSSHWSNPGSAYDRSHPSSGKPFNESSQQFHSERTWGYILQYLQNLLTQNNSFLYYSNLRDLLARLQNLRRKPPVRESVTMMSMMIKNGRRVRVTTTEFMEDGKVMERKIKEDDLGLAPAGVRDSSGPTPSWRVAKESSDSIKSSWRNYRLKSKHAYGER